MIKKPKLVNEITAKTIVKNKFTFEPMIPIKIIMANTANANNNVKNNDNGASKYPGPFLLINNIPVVIINGRQTAISAT